jgi:phage shock protein PspC (stress-responsive transcriptional regulator)
MKKNISINISGIIFHIEEDAYEVLKDYLDSIHRYFSAFDESIEIITDIESRIAEIFLSKLHSNKQVITLEDVKNLIATMGTVHDFQATEAGRTNQDSGKSTSWETPETGTLPKRLYRDLQRKVLGGVCAGMATYFNVDPVWIRLLFVLLTLAWGVILLIYIILWIAVPGSSTLEEPKINKKFYRDPERKVIAGVASGLAVYFGLDIVLVRILFIVFTLFGGLGLVTYIILWIVVAPARTLTDRMQMQGEPITLSNIESTLKSPPQGKAEESALTRILLFPFRLLAWVITAIGRLLAPISEVLRIAIGIALVIAGLAVLVALLTSLGVWFGLFTWHPEWVTGWYDTDFPVQPVIRAIPTYVVLLITLLLFIPSLFIVLFGISTIANRIVFNAFTGWSLFIIFLLTVVALGISLPGLALNFREQGVYKAEQEFVFNGKTPVLRTREAGYDDYEAVTLSLKGYGGQHFKLVQQFMARGKNRADAISQAQKIQYQVQQQDSLLIFDSNIQFSENAPFRAQQLRMTLYVPYNQSFVLDDEIWRLIPQYIHRENRSGQTWKISEKGKLQCITCTISSDWNERSSVPDDEEDYWSESVVAVTNFDEFSQLELNGLYDLTVRKGNRYSVEWMDDNHIRDDYRVRQSDHTLVIEYREKFLNWRKLADSGDLPKIRITMPELEHVEAYGAGKISITGFSADNLNIVLTGAVKCKADLEVRNLTIELTGASGVELEGKGKIMEARLSGASKLEAYDFPVKEAMVSASGASKANVRVTDRLEIRESGASRVRYRGHPQKLIQRK